MVLSTPLASAHCSLQWQKSSSFVYSRVHKVGINCIGKTYHDCMILYLSIYSRTLVQRTIKGSWKFLDMGS